MDAVFDTVAPALVGLDLLAEGDRDRALKLVERAKVYSDLARNSEQAVARKIAEAAQKLIADPKATPDKVVEATVGIPDARAVTTIAEQLERNLTRQARDIVMAKVGEACPRLNTILAEIADRTAEVANALGGVQDAQDAINRGVVDEWREAQALIGQYKDIAELIRELRDLRVIPRPKSSQSGSHWMYLRDEDRSTWLPKDPTPWQIHVRSMSRRPWIPASEDEAAAVLADWNRQAVSA